MIFKRFLPVLFAAFLCNASSQAQFNLIKDFDDGPQNSFGSTYSGILYAVGTKMIVQYDSAADGAHKSIASLAAVDASGNSQWLGFSTLSKSNIDLSPFFDFKTLPDGKVAFVAIESAASFKIILTDGTTAGTTTAYSSTKRISGLEIIDNGLYFTYEGNPKRALMKIDFETAAVSEVATFGNFNMISDISRVANTQLIFMAPDLMYNNAVKLYVSDGTAAGTSELATINTGLEVDQNTVMTQVGNKVYFFYKKPGEDCCNDLWVTDGTIEGTLKLKEFNTVLYADFVREKKAIAWKNKFYFAGVETGASIATDEVFWVSDGTTEGTFALTDADESISPRNLMVFNNTLYFIAFDGSVYNNKLHQTDGTMAGTHVADVKYNGHNLSISSMAADADYIYFGAANVNTTFWYGVFRFDGSNVNVDMLDDDRLIDIPTNLYVHGNDVYFTVNISTTGEELYTIGGDFISSTVTDTKSFATHSCVVYPNPASNQITVKSTERIESIRLINQFGSVLTETTENILSLGAYENGVYFIEINLLSGEKTFEKVILTK